MKCLLCIIDGFGMNADPRNPICHTMPYWQKLWHAYPHTTLQASGEAVGLPPGQMGNSEVGHATIGMGQVITQDLTRLSDLIPHYDWRSIIGSAKRCHILGLFSKGGVHSHKDHYLMIKDALEKSGVPVYLHAFADGRDVPIGSFQKDLKALNPVTVMGRFYAMDRDKRWERTDKAYAAIVHGKGHRVADLHQYVATQDQTDEFIEPAVLETYHGMQADDIFIMVNFRPDRIIQLLSRLTEAHSGFTMTNLPVTLPRLTVLLPKTLSHGGIGEWLSTKGLKQLRIAETEKYAHVTYFFNGGRAEPFPGEDRVLIPSPQVATYDLAPEMSALAITEAALDGMQKGYDMIVMNYANADMVGHTGNHQALCQALTCLDVCLRKVVESAITQGYEMILTSDHGNAEELYGDDALPHTYHTTNPVPFVVINSRAGTKARLAEMQGLGDVKGFCCNNSNAQEVRQV